MLRQKPVSYYHSSIFTKKPKKRSSSTSANKQNLSITHNNSIVLEPNSNLNSKSHLNSKLGKNLNLNKQKSKKTKKSQSRQRSTSKLPLANNLVHEQTKHQPVKQKQHELQAKKTKKSRNNSTSIIYHQKQHKSYTKSFINQSNQLALQMKQKNPIKYPNPMNNNFLHQMSKSSTIVSSTGNIQFSQWSKEDPHDKNYDLLSINNLMGFSKQVKSANNSKRQEYVIKSARQRLSVNNDKYKMNPTRAAVMIQKTWRGYLTRKLLSQYINSFEPMYEEQLKDIRSGRQSRNEAKSIISSNRKCHDQSSFFNKSQLQECSQIQPMESQVSESFRTTNKLHNETSSLLFTQNNNQQEQSSQPKNQLQLSKKNLYISTGKQKNEQLCDMPLQFFKKPVVLRPTTKREQTNSMSDKSNEQYACSSRRKNAMKVTPQTVSRVSQFTVKHPTHTAQTTSRRQQQSKQQTLKHPHHHRSPSNLTICCKTTSISISPPSMSAIQQLQVHCQSLSTLFHSFNSQCIAQLKTQIKMNKLKVNELMERKEALKDIVENGIEFVKNVKEEIAKAFKEMNRIVKEGCDSSNSDRDNNRIYASSSSQSHIDSSAQRPQIPKTINPNTAKTKNPAPFPQQKISNQKQIHDLQSPPFSYESQIDSSSSSRKHYNKRVVRCNTKSGTSEFYTIDLPTEEYEVKSKSPIRQDYQQEEDEEEQSYRQEDYERNDIQGQEDQQEEEYSGRTLRMNPLYSSHQQSLQILNQFLLNLMEQYQQTTATKSISQLQYLCQTLKRVSCDSQNKTIIDRCLIEFIVEIMSETWTLREIYEGFRRVVKEGYVEDNQGEQKREGQEEQQSSSRWQQGTQTNWKLLKTIRKWLQQLYKWEMNIIQEVPSKMQSSSFINTENISLINTQNISINDLREAVNNLSNPANFQLVLHSTYYN